MNMLVERRSFYNTLPADKGINHEGHLFKTNGTIKSWCVFKTEFSLSKNSHFYWFRLNNALPKAWTKIFMTLPLADTISLKSIIYSLKKSNSKELCSQVSLTLELSRKYISKNFFQIKKWNGNLYTLCHVMWLLKLTYIFGSRKFWMPHT